MGSNTSHCLDRHGPSPGKVAPSLTIGLFVPSQLVRGELERLQPDMRWRHAEPSGPVLTASPLPIRAGLSQPVPTTCPLQPPGLPLPELPAHLEHWALGRGNSGRVDMGGGSWAPLLGPPARPDPFLAGSQCLLSLCSAREPAGRGGGRGPWPARAPAPLPGASCCPTSSAAQRPCPGLTKPVCLSAATSTRSCSGLCLPGPR